MHADSAPSTNNEGASYQEMMTQVQEIIRRLEQGSLDVDGLVQEVERGFVLIEKMKTRLQDVKERVDKLKAQFAPADT